MSHENYMRQALNLAAKGYGTVNPNPMVGAVIVKNGQVISEGYHKKPGGPHAERAALMACSPEQADGATLYVTLEPCCHHGRTPPCTDAIIASGISRVVIGMLDPNPLVAGKGVKALQNHGISVEKGILQKECEKLNEVFCHYITSCTPYVVMKYAMTADGKIATATGESQWISGSKAREHTHLLRSQLSGIMVGIGTVLADDPLLNCRLPDGRQPVRIICDSSLRIPLTAKVIKTASKYSTIVATVTEDITKKRQLEAAGVAVIQTAQRNGRVELTDLMRQLGQQQIDSILLEGGGQLNFAALQEGIVQKVLVYIGAKIFGGKDSISPVEGLGISDIAQAFPLTLERTLVLDGDVLLEYKLGGD